MTRCRFRRFAGHFRATLRCSPTTTTWSQSGSRLDSHENASPSPASFLPRSLLVVLVISAVAAGQAPRAVNGRDLPERKAGRPFEFLVAGHLYGSPTPSPRHQPSPTFMRGIDRLAASKADLFVSLGDMVRGLNDADIDARSNRRCSRTRTARRA